MARILIGNVKGPIGATGPDGPRGPEGPQGIQGPLCPLTNNALATVPGVAALDAVMGKTLSDKDAALQTAVTQLNSEVNFSISNPVLNENIVFVKKGNVVYVSFTGNITPGVASKDIILGNLPESFRPRYNVTQHCIWNNVSNQFVIMRSGIVYCYALSAAVQPFRFCIAYLL